MGIPSSSYHPFVRLVLFTLTETERMKLEWELIRAKQHYQDTSYAIVLSLALLQWLRGETPPPKELVYRDRFLDATGKEISSSSGRSAHPTIADTADEINQKTARQSKKSSNVMARL